MYQLDFKASEKLSQNLEARKLSKIENCSNFLARFQFLKDFH